ncbi:hypothetical protein FRC02_010407 [Tulasnella sp. 418]|nr:hypothetical protein FRC02_010407 [Tulasnella sp. 418]
MASPSSAAPLPPFLGPPYPPPLKAPVQIDGTDVSLATEVLPPPPPFFSTSGKRLSEANRKRILPSYLPSTDPGSTYNAGTGVKVVELTSRHEETENDRNHKRKRQRTEKAESSRTKRVPNPSTSSLTEVLQPSHKPVGDSRLPEEAASAEESIVRSSPSLPPVPDVVVPTVPPHLTAARARRSSGLLAASRLSQLDWTVSGNGKRKDREGSTGALAIDTEAPEGAMEASDSAATIRDNGKGKGKAKEDSINSAKCSTCSIPLIYAISGSIDCDGCLRSFHLTCVDPPVDEEVEQGEWFCKKCSKSKAQDSSRPHQSSPGVGGPFAELVQKVSSDIPSIFLLPEDLRNYFRDVATGPNGIYVDTSEFRVGRPNKFGAVEERDPYRLKDRSGAYILCYKCHLSAAPSSYPVEQANVDCKPFIDASEHKGKEIAQLKSETLDGTIGSERGGSLTVTDLRQEQHLWLTPRSMSNSPSPAPSLSQLPSENNGKTSRASSRRSSRRLAVASSSGASTPTPEPPPIIPPAPTPAPVSILDAKTGPGIMFKPNDTFSGWRSMISCDYCGLSWHLDCLTPPLVTLPPSHKKWMCPNHVDHIIPKRRIPRNARTITIPPMGRLPREPTYGNIEVIPEVEPISLKLNTGDTSILAKKRKINGFLDQPIKPVIPIVINDVYLNGVRYRVPEKTIRLDFWNFISNTKDRSPSPAIEPPPVDRVSLVLEKARRTLSSTSSLSSLSSSYDSDDDPMEVDSPSVVSERSDYSLMQAAEALMSMQANPLNPRVSVGVQTDRILLLEPLSYSNGCNESVKSLAELMRTILSTRSTSPSPPNPPNNATLPSQATAPSILEPSSPSKPSAAIPSSPNKPPSFKIRIPSIASRAANASGASSSSNNGVGGAAATTASLLSKNSSSSPNINLNGKTSNGRRSSKKRDSPPQLTSELFPSSTSPFLSGPSRISLSSVAGQAMSRTTTGSSGTSYQSISIEELEQLRAVKELLLRKGEKALLDFICS